MLLLVLVTVLIFYTAISMTDTTVTVPTPSIDEYSRLYSFHAESLSCPCSKVSITYEEFLNIEYRTHEICRSIFIHSDFRDMLFPKYRYMVLLNLDFEMLGAYFFQSFEAFCELTNRTINVALNRLYTSQFITMSISPRQLFFSQIEVLIDQFVASMTNDLMTTLRITQNITFTNALISGRLTNFVISLTSIPGSNSLEIVTCRSHVYDACDCALTPKCKTPATIYFNSTETDIFQIPGLFIGCYITEALLQSTFECFYNASCLQQLQYYLLAGNVSTNIAPLDLSMLHRFSVRSTIEELMNGLMIERWNYSGSFEKYYDRCYPSKCFYTETMRHSVVYIISKLFGIIGGLISVLKFLVWMGLKISIFLLRRQRRRVICISQGNTVEVD